MTTHKAMVTDEMIEAGVEEIRRARHQGWDRWTDHDAIRAVLTAALAQAETQPVAYIRPTDAFGSPMYAWRVCAISDPDARPVFASPVPAKREARLNEEMGLIRWAHDTLIEINEYSYTHDDVCELNAASVEVILRLAPILGETHGKSKEWWAERALSTSSTPADGEGLTTADDSQERLSSMSDHSCKTSAPAHVPDVVATCCGKPMHVGSPEGYTLECCQNFIVSDRREAIARIIDPHSFMSDDSGDCIVGEIVKQSRDLALRKADCVIETISSSELPNEPKRPDLDRSKMTFGTTDRGELHLFGHWSKHKLADGVFLPLVCYVPTGPDYTTVPLYASATPADGEDTPAPVPHVEWPHEAVCRLIHDNAGTKDPDEPWPHPAQKSWEEPMLRRWQQWEGLSDELRELLKFQQPQSYELYATPPQPNLAVKADAFDQIVAARKAHVEAVAAYNARLKLVKSERERGNHSLSLDREYEAMTEAQLVWHNMCQGLADAALATPAPQPRELPTTPSTKEGSTDE